MSLIIRYQLEFGLVAPIIIVFRLASLRDLTGDVCQTERTLARLVMDPNQ